MEEAERDLIVNDISEYMGSGRGVNIEEEESKFMEHSCVEKMLVGGSNKFVDQNGVAMDVTQGVGGNRRREAEGSMAANIKETSAMVGVIKLVILIVTHGVDAIPEGVGNEGIIQASLASDIGRSICVLRVQVSQYIIKCGVGAYRGHQVRIPADFFIEISDYNDVATCLL
jgi:hypothetical protein